MAAALFRKLPATAEEAPPLTLSVDGQPASAEAGDSVASVLLRLEMPLSRTTPVAQSPRTPYCMMGVCFDCLAIVDGVASMQTCLVQVRQGMCVERQHGRRAIVIESSGGKAAGAT